MIREHDRVVLTADLPDDGLIAGDVGVVVHIYAGGRGYEVEFFTLTGTTATVASIAAESLRAVRREDRLHVRVAA